MGCQSRWVIASDCPVGMRNSTKWNDKEDRPKFGDKEDGPHGDSEKGGISRGKQGRATKLGLGECWLKVGPVRNLQFE